MTPGTWGEDGIPYNAFVRRTSSTAVGTPTVSVTGNSGPAVIIGDAWLGLARELGDFLHGRTLDPGETFAWESGLAPYDDAEAARRISGRLLLTTAELAVLQAVWLATRKGTRPALLIPDSAVNDAWLATFQYTADHVEGHHEVNIEIVERPRVRW